jgi:hypothetical protein
LEYEQMMNWLPYLEHLPPPMDINRIRMDRFSPNFVDSSALGFTGVKPSAAYSYIYPFPTDVLSRLAYYFDFDYKQPQPHHEWLSELVARVHWWQRSFEVSDLFYVDKGDAAVVVDLRSCSSRRTSVLRGAPHTIMQFCDEVRSRQAIVRIVQEQFSSEGTNVDSILADLTKLGFLISDGRNFLTLAIPLADYTPRVGVLRALQNSELADYESLSSEERKAEYVKSLNERFYVNPIFYGDILGPLVLLLASGIPRKEVRHEEPYAVDAVA